MQMLQDNPFESPTPTGGPVRHPVRFAGKGDEYFRIWIVNVALSLITLGIYSAWAKVRRLNYFYRQTSLAGSSFEYHGQPMAILKGRILAVGLLVLWNVAPEIHPIFFAVVFVAGLVVLPWLLTSALRFRLHNSSYRGLRFSFRGSTGATAKAFYPGMLLTSISFGLAFPWFVWRIKKYFFDHAAYGSLRAIFQARAGQFYKVYLMVGVVFSVTLIGVAVWFAASLGWRGEDDNILSLIMRTVWLIPLLVFVALAMYIGGLAYARARIHALSWDGLRLDGHTFRCDLDPWRFAGITLRNLVLTMLTLGFYKPFSDIQLARLLAESIQLDAAADLESVVAQNLAEERAGGEEAAEFFDMDIGL